MLALPPQAPQPTATAPIASATSVAQLDELLPAMTLELKPEQLARLDAVSAPARADA